MPKKIVETEHVSITLPIGLSEQAKALGINISFVAARAVTNVIYKEMPKCRRCRWLEVCIDPCCEGDCPKHGEECGCEQGDAVCQTIAGTNCKKYEVRTLIKDPEVEKIKKWLS